MNRYYRFKHIKHILFVNTKGLGMAKLRRKPSPKVLQPKMFYVQRVSSTLLWDFGAKAERARTIAALRLARHEGQDGRFMGHAPYVAHGPRNALRTGSLIGRHLYLCTMTVVVT